MNMKHNKLVILFLAGLFTFVFCLWQNNDIVVSNYLYKTSKINADFNGYKIAQISDLHNKKFGKDQKNLLSIVKNEKPDIIVITGDIADSKNTDIDAALNFVYGAVKIAPVYYVTGNHEEYWLSDIDRDRLMQGMEQLGATILNNKIVALKNENGNDLFLIGLSDSHLSDNTLSALLSGIDPNKLHIVLAHDPNYLDNYSSANADLVFSGHIHGGQVRLPFIGGIVAPNYGLFPKYTAGTYLKDSTTMVVSRGLGNSVIPIRIFNRPEVVIVKLAAGK